jgi:hypothetical protein
MLEELEPQLNERDKNILRTIQISRYITTSQISRLFFRDSASESAALRTASRNLEKLKSLQLIDSLPRRIGGTFSGSGSFIWNLDSAGEHRLRVIDKTARPHRKNFEPSQYFLAHTLMVTECFVRLTEICRKPGMLLTEIQNEPQCWRPYMNSGKQIALKPDLFAITRCDSYEDRWFFEIDLATESPIKVIEKCQRYHQYYRTGLEQQEHNVFPLTVWIAPDVARKNRIDKHLKEAFKNLPDLFVVITPDELEPLIQQEELNAKGSQP